MSMIKMTSMAIAASMTLGFAGIVVSTGESEARPPVKRIIKRHIKRHVKRHVKRVVRHGHYGHGHSHYYGNGYYYGYGYRGCRFLKRRAIRTQSPYWWGRYQVCIGA